MDRDILPIIWDQCLDNMFMPPTSKNLKRMVGGGGEGYGADFGFGFFRRGSVCRVILCFRLRHLTTDGGYLVY